MDDITILVAPGVPGIESGLAQRIRAWGYRTQVVTGPPSALDPTVGLVICDHTVLRAWMDAVGSETTQRVPFVALVSTGARTAGRAAWTTGAFEVLPWPCPDSMLGLTLTRALRWHALLAERPPDPRGRRPTRTPAAG